MLSPVYLNLLSPHKKARLANILTYIFFKEVLELLLFTSAVLATAFLFGWLILNDVVSEFERDSTMVSHDYSIYNQEIRQANLMIKNIIASGKNFYMLSPKILEFSELLPGTIKLGFFGIDRETNTLTISGTAATRDALLQFQDVLQRTAWLKNVSAPNSQLFQKENVSFQITAELNGIPPLKNPKAPRASSSN